jgi:hypothetical protein
MGNYGQISKIEKKTNVFRQSQKKAAAGGELPHLDKTARGRAVSSARSYPTAPIVQDVFF